MSEEATGPRDRLRHALGSAAEALTPQAEGLERIPHEGAAILAFNHVTSLDVLLGRLVEGRRIHFVSSHEATGGLRGWLGRRSRGERTPSDAEDLAEGSRNLQRGDLLGIFPEGPRSPDGRLYRGEVLVARLALAHDVPLLPVAVVPAPGRSLAPRVRVGEPLDLARFRDGQPDTTTLRTVTDAVMYALLELSGQTYLDVPITQRRVELAGQRREAQQRHRDETAARRAEREAALQQRRADREAEAVELARAHAVAVEAAREHARRAAEADRLRREVRGTRAPAARPTPNPDLTRPRTISLLEDDDTE